MSKLLSDEFCLGVTRRSLEEILSRNPSRFCRTPRLNLGGVPLGFLAKISGDICGTIREGVSGGIFGEICGKYLNYARVKFLKELLKFLEEFSKESMNYLAAKFSQRNSLGSPRRIL